MSGSTCLVPPINAVVSGGGDAKSKKDEINPGDDEVVVILELEPRGIDVAETSTHLRALKIAVRTAFQDLTSVQLDEKETPANFGRVQILPLCLVIPKNELAANWEVRDFGRTIIRDEVDALRNPLLETIVNGSGIRLRALLTTIVSEMPSNIPIHVSFAAAPSLQQLSKSVNP